MSPLLLSSNLFITSSAAFSFSVDSLDLVEFWKITSSVKGAFHQNWPNGDVSVLMCRGRG